MGMLQPCYVSGRAHVASLPGLESRTWFALPHSPQPNPFPPSTPPNGAFPALCSRPSPVLWVCQTSRCRSSRLYFPFDRADLGDRPRPTTGPPGFRARSFSTCMGSTTTRSLRASCDSDAPSVAFRPKPGRRHSVQGLFRGSIPSPHLPLSTLATTPRGETAMTRGPVWSATPSLQGTSTLNSLPAYPGASAFSPLHLEVLFPGASPQAGMGSDLWP